MRGMVGMVATVAATTVLAINCGVMSMWMNVVREDVDRRIALATEELTEKLREELAPEKAPDMVYLPIELAKNRTLAVQNKNPLNVKVLYSGEKWQGQVGVDRQGHVKFGTWEHGVRAAASTLISYEKKYGINTIRGIVTRFSQSNHDSYCALLSKALGLGTDEPFAIHKRLPDLLKAMCKMECSLSLPETILVPYTLMEKL